MSTDRFTTQPPAVQVLVASLWYWLRWPAFIAAYVVLDWASFLHPLDGLNITPWNPAPALGLVLWLRLGWRTMPPWIIAVLFGEYVVRGFPAGLPATIAFSVVLTAGYGVLGEALRRHLPTGEVLADRRSLIVWLGIIGIGSLMNSAIYISLLAMLDVLPAGDRIEGIFRFWIGDGVGTVVTMPILWMLVTPREHERLLRVLKSWETVGYLALAMVMLWFTFGTGVTTEFQYFYFLFLPVVWAASRQGLPGAALSAFVVQGGVIVAVELLSLVAVTLLELQVLGAVLTLVGFFIGIVVDEQRAAAEKLRQSLHLAAAGEMAAALAHELNQPMTALAAFGNACEYLLDKGETGEPLKEAIRRMVAESGRATEVVRRLRDFFRTGATRLEPTRIGPLVEAAAARFAARAAAEGVEIRITPLPEVEIFVDRLQIELVLRNLLENALDAVAEQTSGSRRISLHAHLDGKGLMTVVIEDSGRGLSPAAAKNLFEPFSSTKSSGLGLGLTISRALIDAHGGELRVEPGNHGYFSFTLPISSDERRDADA